jgi:hypothetical protein
LSAANARAVEVAFVLVGVKKKARAVMLGRFYWRTRYFDGSRVDSRRTPALPVAPPRVEPPLWTLFQFLRFRTQHDRPMAVPS